MEIYKLKEILKKRKITYAKLSEMSGVPIQTIQKIFSGNTTAPRIDTLDKIEKALDIKQEIFTFNIPGIEPLPSFRSVPLVGTIACGTPTLAEENIEAFIRMSENINADFALRCRGSSMINARIFDGDIGRLI